MYPIVLPGLGTIERCSRNAEVLTGPAAVAALVHGPRATKSWRGYQRQFRASRVAGGGRIVKKTYPKNTMKIHQ